jgi:hypothetical protein
MSNPLDVISQVIEAISTGGLSALSDLPGTVQDWLSSAGGNLASGIEGGFVSLLKDLWDVILGPMEIFVGFVFIIFAFYLAFKDDMIQAARLFGFAGV